MDATKIIEQYKSDIATQEHKKFVCLNPQSKIKYISFVFLNPIYDKDIQLSPASRQLNTMTIRYMQSVGIVFGYLFETNNLVVNMFDDYFVASRPSVANLDSYSGVMMPYQSQFINVYESQEGAAFVSSNDLYEVITSDLVRKSSK